jgi:hypothetical protein
MQANPTLPWNRRGEMTPHKLNNSLFFGICFSISYFFLAIGKEAERRWKIVQEDFGCVGATTSFIASWCNNRGSKVAGLHRHGKKKQ